MTHLIDELTERSNARLATEVKGLLETVSDAEFRAIGIEALRRWRRRETASPPPTSDHLLRDPNTVFALNGIGADIAQLLADRKGVEPSNVHALKEVFLWDGALLKDWMSPMTEFIWWLVRSGLAVEYGYGYKGPPSQYPILRVFPASLRLTARGVRLLDSVDEDDPLVPGFLGSIRRRCPDLSAGVLEMLADARSCLDLSLVRPAVLVLGAAYEQAIEDAIDEMVTRNLLNKTTLALGAAKRLERIRDFLASADAKHVLHKPDDGRRIAAAIDFADVLRLARNDVSHGLSTFDYTKPEADDLLVRAGFHLPGLWLLAADPPIT